MIEIIKPRFKVYFDELVETDGFITSKQLAVQANVSTRTIKTDILELNKIISNYGAKIESKRGYGYYLTVIQNDKFTNFKKYIQEYYTPKNNVQMLYNSTNRIEYIIRKLLVIDYCIKLQEIEEEIFVSKATLSRDLKTVKKILKNYDLEVKTIPKKGIVIEGDEISRRLCIAEYFFQKYSEDFYVFDNPMLINQYSQREIKYIRNSLVNVSNKYNVHFSDLTIQNLVIHIYIALKRNSINQIISSEEIEKKSNIEEKAFLVANEMSDLLEKRFQIKIPITERKYYSIHISTKQLLEYGNDNDKYRYLLDDIINIIKEKYRIDFSNSQVLHNYLSVHISAMIKRLENHMYMRNTSAKEIIRSYILASSITLSIASYINQVFNVKIEDNEFSYLVLYINVALKEIFSNSPKKINVLSGRGRPESIMLTNELQELFGALISEVNIIDESKMNIINSDEIVLTTMPINDVPNKNNTIYVNGTVSDYYEVIRKMLIRKDGKDVRLRTLLKSNLFFTIDPVNKDETFSMIIEGLINRGIAKIDVNGLFQNYMDVANEVKFNTVLLQSTYIPKEPYISIVVLQKPIIWEHESIQVIIINQCGSLPYEEYQSVCTKITQLINTENIRLLIDGIEYEELIRKFEEFELYKVGRFNE